MNKYDVFNLNETKYKNIYLINIYFFYRIHHLFSFLLLAIILIINLGMINQVNPNDLPL